MAKQINRVEHEGKIVEISESFINVEIINKSACAACHAKGVCAASDMSIKYIEVAHTIETLSQDYKVGDIVNVVMKGSLGLRAVWIAYVVPLIVLMASILILSLSGAKEVYVGLVSLAIVAVYYLDVYIMRDKLSKIFTFYIEPK